MFSNQRDFAVTVTDLFKKHHRRFCLTWLSNTSREYSCTRFNLNDLRPHEVHNETSLRHTWYVWYSLQTRKIWGQSSFSLSMKLERFISRYLLHSPSIIYCCCTDINRSELWWEKIYYHSTKSKWPRPTRSHVEFSAWTLDQLLDNLTNFSLLLTNCTSPVSASSTCSHIVDNKTQLTQITEAQSNSLMNLYQSAAGDDSSVAASPCWSYRLLWLLVGSKTRRPGTHSMCRWLNAVTFRLKAFISPVTPAWGFSEKLNRWHYSSAALPWFFTCVGCKWNYEDGNRPTSSEQQQAEKLKHYHPSPGEEDVGVTGVDKTPQRWRRILKRHSSAYGLFLQKDKFIH